MKNFLFTIIFSTLLVFSIPVEANNSPDKSIFSSIDELLHYYPQLNRVDPIETFDLEEGEVALEPVYDENHIKPDWPATVIIPTLKTAEKKLTSENNNEPDVRLMMSTTNTSRSIELPNTKYVIDPKSINNSSDGIISGQIEYSPDGIRKVKCADVFTVGGPYRVMIKEYPDSECKIVEVVLKYRQHDKDSWKYILQVYLANPFGS